jgi:short-subunit dehydrogenase
MTQAARKVAIVFGYGPGIGHSVANKWSANGFRVALCSRTASKLEDATKIIPNSHAFPCDCSDAESVTSTIQSVESTLGEVDALLWNAGNGVFKKFDEISVVDFHQAMAVNVYGLLAATQVCIPKMKTKENGGFVCVTGATASLRGMPFTSCFAAAKAAQLSLSQSIARQVWKDGVHVTYNIIDAAVGKGEGKMNPDSIANEYWHLSQQSSDCWTFKNHIQRSGSDMALL